MTGIRSTNINGKIPDSSISSIIHIKHFTMYKYVLVSILLVTYTAYAIIISALIYTCPNVIAKGVNNCTAYLAIINTGTFFYMCALGVMWSFEKTSESDRWISRMMDQNLSETLKFMIAAYRHCNLRDCNVKRLHLRYFNGTGPFEMQGISYFVHIYGVCVCNMWTIYLL